MARVRLASLSIGTTVLAVSQLAFQCPPLSPPDPGANRIEISQPSSTLVSECLPEVRFELVGKFDPGSVEVLLNGNPLEAIQAGSGEKEHHSRRGRGRHGRHGRGRHGHDRDDDAHERHHRRGRDHDDHDRRDNSGRGNRDRHDHRGRDRDDRDRHDNSGRGNGDRDRHDHRGRGHGDRDRHHHQPRQPLVFTAATTGQLESSNVLEVTARPRRQQEAIHESIAFDFQPPVLARRISESADLITGPLAHSRIGDWLIRNCTARFIIQDAPQRDMYSVGAFGGNLIDLELIGHEGLDNFIEIAPTLDAETVVNPQTVEIVNDGSNGEPASIRSCGPDDLLDFINPSSQISGLPGVMIPVHADDFDLPIEGCTLYSLEPFSNRIRMDTTVTNNGGIPFPLLVGDWINPGGELENLFTPGDGPGAGLTADLGAISWLGYGEAAGVDYAYTTLPLPDYSGPLKASFLNTSGVTLILHTIGILPAILGTNSPFLVLPGQSRTYTRYLAVGDGSASNSVDLVADIREQPVGQVEGCVTVGGEPAAGARVPIGTRNGPEIGAVHTLFTTDESGCYAGGVPPTPGGQEYAVAASLIGHLYEGGGLDPLLHSFTVAQGETVVLPTIDLPLSGELLVRVTDGRYKRTPARVTLVGLDPSPEPIIPGGSLFGLSIGDLGLFRDPSDSYPFGVVTAHYTRLPSGAVRFPIEPGSYELYVSRGPEYSIFRKTVTIVPGQTQMVHARIDRVIDTEGFISSDFHVHGIRSADSRVSDTDRVLQFAGEGVDNVIMTDHGVHTDLKPRIAQLGLGRFVTATVGEEITTFDYGHFNGYPFLVDPTRASGGSTDWGVAAPAGMDFPQYGALNATPPEIYQLAIAGPQSTPNTAVHVNHIGSHFGPLKIDTGIVPFADQLNPAERQALRLPDTGNLFQVFDGLELWNGETRGAQNTFLVERIGVWFNHLNRGIPITFIADTDTHEFFNLRTSGARTWTASSSDKPRRIDPQEVGAAVLTGRAVGGQGPYVQTQLHAADGSGRSADLRIDGQTLVETSNGAVDLEIDVQAPLWAQYDRIEIYANATTIPDGAYEYGAIPDVILTKDIDFSVETRAIDPHLPAAGRLETRGLVVPFTGLTEDTWFVVVVKGSDGVSEPMFPVFAASLDRSSNNSLEDLNDGNLGEGGVMALGATNALYADVDGSPGFQLGL